MPQPLSQDKPGLADFALLHFIVLLWGFTAILGALCSLSPVEVVWWRTGLAILVMWPLFWRQVRASAAAGMGRGVVLQILGTGGLIATHWFLFFLAARVGNVSSCLAGIATGSVWAALLEPAFERRAVRRADLATALVVLAGLLVIFWQQADAASGVAIGVVSAAFAAMFSILNRHFVQQTNPYTISVLGLTGAFLSTCLLQGGYAVLLGLPLLPHIPIGYDWLWLGLLAVVCTVFAFSASVNLLKKFSAFSATLAVNMEPIYGILLALLIFGQREAMTTGFYIGTLLILAAVVGHPLLESRLGKRDLRIDN